MAGVNFDTYGNIISVTPDGKKQPMYYPQITVPDGTNTAGMVVDVTKNPPVLAPASATPLPIPPITSGRP